MSADPIARAGLLAALVALAASAALGAGRRPRYVSYVLAGTRLQDASNDAARQDRPTGYRLVGSRECDGGHLSLGLRPQEALTDGSGYSSEVLVCRLPTLATGHGIMIGDAPQTVRQRLGMPTRVEWARKKPGLRIYSYRYIYRYREGHVVMEYEAAYTFRNARLWQIELREDTIEGG
jgi:hypothetical protein